MKETKSEIMKGIKCKSSKIVGNNTIEYTDMTGNKVIRLHHTNIIKFMVNGDIVLNSGNWETNTTKNRINRFLDVKDIFLLSKSGQWFLQKYNTDKKYWFVDGMIIKKNGKIEGAREYIDVSAITKKLKKYVDDYIIALDKGDVEAPGLGDCLYCSATDDKTKQMMGEAIKDTDHIESHIKEKYYVPSLLAQAIKVFPISSIVQRCLFDIWHNSSNGSDNKFYNDFAMKQLKKSLYRFVKRQYGLQA
jgi:hypothetical protein